ncbi:MAG: pitrilysin family protein [Bacteroidales bacterium]|nr:pitrilysin family protein [Bacteroidales bacterium]
MINRKTAPKTEQISNLNLLQPEELFLNNGVKLFIFKSDITPVIKLDVIFKAGIEYETKKLQAVFANALIKEAPKGMDPDKTSEFFDYYGCHIESFTSNDTAGFRLYVPNKFLDKVLPAFADLLINPSLPLKEFEILKSKYFETLKNSMTKTKHVAMRGLNTELFGKNHPRGFEIVPEDVLLLSIDDIKDFVKQNYSISDSFIQISGMVDDEIISLCNKFFINKNLISNKIKKTLEINESKNSFRLFEMNDSVQSSIYIGKNLGKISNEELIDMDILNTVLGGYFGSRLMKNIREDKGYTYGIGSFLSEYNDCVVLKITSDVGVDVTQNAIDEIFEEIKILTEKRIHYQELNLVRNYMLGEMLSSFDGVFQISAIWERLITTNKSPDFIINQVNRIKNISTKELLLISNKFLKDIDFHTVVAGKCKF